jgi:hypothetical protein
MVEGGFGRLMMDDGWWMDDGTDRFIDHNIHPSSIHHSGHSGTDVIDIRGQDLANFASYFQLPGAPAPTPAAAPAAMAVATAAAPSKVGPQAGWHSQWGCFSLLFLALKQF